MLKVSEYFPKEEYDKILDLDESIRFVGRIKNRHVVAFVRRKGSESLMDEELGNLAHYQASVKANMDEMFDSQLGKTNWMITCKELVKMITLFLDDGLLILSMDSAGNHDQVIQKIQRLNTKF
jgi:hypothetical protein